jgi:NAD(P)-dependent dehydrogenase (short-subunit alcohol dehydrogenase family)
MSRTCLITGASRGIGFATAVALAEEGFDIAALALPDPERMDELRQKVGALGRRFSSYELDLGQIEAHAAVIARVLDDFGAIDCLVNNAGVSVLSRGDLLEMSVASYDRCFTINTRGTFFFTQAVARLMARTQTAAGNYRSIIFITSSNAVVVGVERGEYCMSKTALSMASKLFALRLAEYGIAVFEVQPGVILTEMTAPVKPKYDALIAQGLIIEPRWGMPEDVARVVRTMAAGLLPYTVAQDVRVDGGMMIKRF